MEKYKKADRDLVDEDETIVQNRGIETSLKVEGSDKEGSFQ